MYAWEGSNEQPDHSRFNLAYWQHYDRIIETLNRRGMIAHILIKVYNKMVNWPSITEEDLFFRWLMARYAAFPNVHWDFSKEANNEKDLNYKRDRIAFLRQNDPYHRPITVHDDRQTYDEERPRRGHHAPTAGPRHLPTHQLPKRHTRRDNPP